MTSFTPFIKKRAIRIMENLFKHPCSSTFQNPIEIGIDADSDYHSRVKNPIDLTTILKKLKNDEYNLYSEWLIDVERCWSNAEQYNSEDTPFATCARQMRKVFNHEKKKLCVSPAAWSSRLFQLRLKMAILESDAPPKVKAGADHQSAVPTITKYESSFSPHELQCLSIAIEMISTMEEVKEIQKLINETYDNVDLDAEPISFSLPRLPWSTLVKIQTFLQKALPLKGLEYPS